MFFGRATSNAQPRKWFAAALRQAFNLELEGFPEQASNSEGRIRSSDRPEPQDDGTTSKDEAEGRADAQCQ